MVLLGPERCCHCCLVDIRGH
uniref:Uncharacterized protein n=1 Tax=Arundo donax TaxID=35708 RepID=A0A0A9F1N8_ARUDO